MNDALLSNNLNTIGIQRTNMVVVVFLSKKKQDLINQEIVGLRLGWFANGGFARNL